jgi:hypothetical protein
VSSQFAFLSPFARGIPTFPEERSALDGQLTLLTDAEVHAVSQPSLGRMELNEVLLIVFRNRVQGQGAYMTILAHS